MPKVSCGDELMDEVPHVHAEPEKKPTLNSG